GDGGGGVVLRLHRDGQRRAGDLTGGTGDAGDRLERGEPDGEPGAEVAGGVEADGRTDGHRLDGDDLALAERGLRAGCRRCVGRGRVGRGRGRGRCRRGGAGRRGV